MKGLNSKMSFNRKEYMKRYMAIYRKKLSYRNLHKRVIAKWQRNNPEKVRAYSAVHKALRTGVLVKPEACEGCGNTGKLHAHHPDYKNKLDVVWLCETCHKQTHLVRSYA